MKIKISDIRKLARTATQNLKASKRQHKSVEGTEVPSCSMSQDIGYWEGYLHALGTIYNLRSK